MGLSNGVVDFLFHPASRLSVVNKGIIGSAKVTVDGVDRNIELIDTFLYSLCLLKLLGS